MFEGVLFCEIVEEVVWMIIVCWIEFCDYFCVRGGEIFFLLFYSLMVIFLLDWLMWLKVVIGQMISCVKFENFDRCIEVLIEGGYDFFLIYVYLQVNILLDLQGYLYFVVGYDSLVVVVWFGWLFEWLIDGMLLLKYLCGSFFNEMVCIVLV